MKKIDISKEMKDKIIAPLPSQLILERDAGKSKLSYISGATVIDMLNNIFGYTWSWEVKRQWIEDSQPFFNKYSKAPGEKEYFNGGTGNWEAQAPVAHVHGTLTVYIKDDNDNLIEIKKDGQGSKAIIGKQSEQDAIFKSAGTDALKKAASLLGIGLQLYRKEEEQAYFDEMNYEDPWDEAAQEKFKDEIEYVFAYVDTAGLNQDAIAELIEAATGYMEYDILPSNIEAIYNYLVSLAEAE